jgi:hypothetical protein
MACCSYAHLETIERGRMLVPRLRTAQEGFILGPTAVEEAAHAGDETLSRGQREPNIDLTGRCTMVNRRYRRDVILVPDVPLSSSLTSRWPQRSRLPEGTKLQIAAATRNHTK